MKCITVIVAVYNVEKYIEKCLLSICNQTYKNLEIIVVDDGSTDESGNICDKAATHDSRIQVIHKKNQGVSSARNIGLDLATGDYVTFVDGDDYIDKDMYSSMMKQLSSNDIQMAICSFRYIYYKKNKDEKSYFTKDIVSQEEYLNSLLKDAFGFYYSVVWNKLISREVIKNNSLVFDEQWQVMEDFGFVLRLLPYVKKIAVCNKPLYNYRKNNFGTATNRKISFAESFINRKQGYLWLKECLLSCGYYEQNKKWLGDYLIRYLASQYSKAVYSENKKDRIYEHKEIKKHSFLSEELSNISIIFKIKRKIYWNIQYLFFGMMEQIRKRMRKYEKNK